MAAPNVLNVALAARALRDFDGWLAPAAAAA
jgi:hypothetical protein